MPTKQLYLGALSGTSIDAIDIAITAIDAAGIELVSSYSHPFPPALKQQLQQLCSPHANELVNYGLADRDFALETAKAVQHALAAAGVQPQEIIAIGSHGQTVRHHPELTPAFSLQLGCPATLAANTGIAVVSHFRQKDIAVGGQGAPLAPALHQALFHSTEYNRAVINLGGIANISWLPASGDITGFDCGPANTLLDAWYQQHHKQAHFDRDGAWARSGQPLAPLLEACLADPYFQLAAPKSTGREYFNLRWLHHKLAAFTAVTGQEPTPTDVQATLLELTAHTVGHALMQQGHCDQVYLCGGGVKNTYLVERLQALTPNIDWHSTAVLGVDPEWVEAILFAWLAYAHVTTQAGNVTQVTGAKRPVVLGSYTPAL
ncbi:anhydro-N-acetylmuramic acid kinase [Aliidiomarina taiwanensis]|uniref:Anhydro-N-acetylmuramic acid kinase n=1 Tax=Aliidiomarina taiwanensis TaxID=946228 RepID=A0A432X1F8_9GAMM|nr:anhydro-N-acetylmuramic acid kinase [Aliidiomarina taiwanensis]RUO40057.1 anhydro-N-acetylmuramic acid kinase [Aliidiomarina taiwanensis]